MRVLSLAVLVTLTAVAANAAFTQEMVFEWDADTGITYEVWDVSSLISPSNSIYFEFNWRSRTCSIRTVHSLNPKRTFSSHFDS